MSIDVTIHSADARVVIFCKINSVIVVNIIFQLRMSVRVLARRTNCVLPLVGEFWSDAPRVSLICVVQELGDGFARVLEVQRSGNDDETSKSAKCLINVLVIPANFPYQIGIRTVIENAVKTRYHRSEAFVEMEVVPSRLSSLYRITEKNSKSGALNTFSAIHVCNVVDCFIVEGVGKEVIRCRVDREVTAMIERLCIVTKPFRGSGFVVKEMMLLTVRPLMAIVEWRSSAHAPLLKQLRC